MVQASLSANTYADYQITREQDTYILWIWEIASAAQTTLDTLQEVLDDLESAAAGEKIKKMGNRNW